MNCITKNDIYFRLRTSGTQYRLEVDRLKADLQCDQVKIQQLEREIIDLKRETNQLDNYSTNVESFFEKYKQRMTFFYS